MARFALISSFATICALFAACAITPSAETIRVMTYNVYYVFDHGKQVELGTEWLREQAPDVLALQELTSISDEHLAELAAGWGHEHSVLLKNSGFSVGLTSHMPIETIERRVEGMHHGYLHARVAGVHYFVVHLSPFLWERRLEEAEILLGQIQPLLDAGVDVIVLGDFNAMSAVDRAEMDAQPEQLQKSRDSDAQHGHVQNLRDGEFDYSVMARFFDAGLVDLNLPFLEASQDVRWTFTTGIWTPKNPVAPSGGSRIDFILGSPNLAPYVNDASIPRIGAVNLASDHYPVWVELNPRN